MKDLLNLILQNITTHPEEVQVDESNQEGRLVYTISVHPDDMGRVIGKNGKVIKAIRSIGHVVAIRRDERYRINVAEAGEEDTGEEEVVVVEETPATKTEAPVETPPAETPVTEAPKADDTELISGAIEVAEQSVDPEEPEKKPKKTKK